MQHRFASNSLGIIVAAALLAACAETRTAAPTLTSADVPAAPPDEALTAAMLPAPPGRLACKATSPYGVTSVLFLEWSGANATGVLRSVAPTGAVTDQKVTATRHDGTTLVDDASQDDFVSHVALLQTIDGAPYLRFSDETDWMRCE